MHIYVDADACPVIGIVERIAKSHNIAVTLLCDTNHYLKSDYSEVVYVGAGADAVVFYFSVVVFVVKFSVLHPAFKLFLSGIAKNLCQRISKINNPYLFYVWSVR